MLSKQITKGIATCKWSNYCQMSLPLTAILEIREYNYFSERMAIKNKLIRIFFDCDDITQLKGRTFIIETNALIYNAIISDKSNPHKHLLLISKPTEEYTGIQPFEKLQLMNPLFVFRNIVNLKFYKHLFKRENIYVFKISFLD